MPIAPILPIPPKKSKVPVLRRPITPSGLPLASRREPHLRGRGRLGGAKRAPDGQSGRAAWPDTNFYRGILAMKLRTWAIAALAACLVAASSTPSLARNQEDLGPTDSPEMSDMSQDMGQPADMMEQSELGAYNSCETCPSGGCGGYGSGGMLGGGGLLGDMTGGRRVQVVAGAEYIYAQATFSDALAFVEQDTVAGGETFHQIDFDYESSYSFYGGFYLPDCGGAVIAEYTRLTSEGEFEASDSAFVNIFGPFEVDGNIEGEADVDLKSYDLTFSKTIPLGCLASGAECGDACDDQCCDSGCGWCPAWDITWSGGVRFAEVEWGHNVTATDEITSVFIDSADTSLDFDGFGGRVGILGRRYLGRRGLFSLYGKGDFSVLFGEVDIETILANPTAEAFIRTSNDITVPVTEVELGSSAHLGEHATLSAGYFWSAWHDLGMSQTTNFGNLFQLSHYDDANILGWNGFFARAEVAF